MDHHHQMAATWNHTNHKGFMFNMFLLLENHRINACFNLTLELTIDLKDLCFMSLFMCKHNTHTQFDALPSS
jgi:hypothetical protein